VKLPAPLVGTAEQPEPKSSEAPEAIADGLSLGMALVGAAAVVVLPEAAFELGLELHAASPENSAAAASAAADLRAKVEAGMTESLLSRGGR
jgi:hypothetical protein